MIKPLIKHVATIFSHRPYFRSSSEQKLLFTGVLKNFAILAGKRLCWSLFLIKIDQSFRLATLLKKHSNTGVFL